VSLKNTADKFVNWAAQTLFTAQMGTNDQKNLLVSNLLGVYVESVKEVFSKTSNTIPCVYLFYIGKVKKLRKILKISDDFEDDDFEDDDFVYKWGMTNDLKRRIGEHYKTYSKMQGAKLELVLYNFVDIQFMSQAETKLKHLFEGLELVLPHEKYDEHTVIPKNKMKLVKEQYSMISDAYIGHVREFINKIKEKDNEIAMLKEKHQNELLKKDLEIANLKLQYSSSDHLKNMLRKNIIIFFLTYILIKL